ncbi:MAG: hypothetical protein IPG00_11360 [Saprospiraceae bacterium]|nr:hypothetical protein [Saprospiraceae bacterium]
MLTCTLIGQKSFTKADVRNMFPSSTKDLWINNLCGTLDKVHVVEMIIGTDGHTCKGLYRMRNSGITFLFEGKDVNHQLQLVELNDENRRSGFIYGQYDGETFTGSWMNADKNITFPLNLNFVSAFDNYQSEKCRKQHWQRIYTGKADDKDLILQISKDDLLFTICNHENEVRMKDVIVGKGSRVEILKFGTENAFFANKSIVLDTADLGKISIIQLDDNGYEVSSSLYLTSYLEHECFEYTDYKSKLICHRPVTGNKKFDIWMESKFRQWSQENISRLKSGNHDASGTTDRWIQAVDAWVEIDLFLRDLISGTIYLQSSLATGTVKIPFIYDMKSDKEVVLNDIFDNKFDHKAYFQKEIEMQKEAINWDISIKKWVANQPFTYGTLCDDGISFTTDFSTIYGEKEIVIPYTEIKQFIKNKNLLKDLFGK